MASAFLKGDTSESDSHMPPARQTSQIPQASTCFPTNLCNYEEQKKKIACKMNVLQGEVTSVFSQFKQPVSFTLQ